MLVTIHDDTYNVFNMQHKNPKFENWDYSDIPDGGTWKIKMAAPLGWSWQLPNNEYTATHNINTCSCLLAHCDENQIMLLEARVKKCLINMDEYQQLR